MVSPTAPVGPFRVSTLTSLALVEALSDLVEGHGVRIAYALHVEGLSARDRKEVVSAYASADLVYADGTSISLVSRMTNGHWIDRSATTDIGVPVLLSAAKKLDRPVRLALIGGPDGLAKLASEALNAHPELSVEMATHGFHLDWREVIAELRSRTPDVVLVGMGCPAEMLWVEGHRSELPQAFYLTCGGWFRFLAGDERRAPATAQRLGLEWVFRVAQDPKGKAGRYARGVVSVIGSVRDARRRRVLDIH